jgi:hypothetical protein
VTFLYTNLRQAPILQVAGFSEEEIKEENLAQFSILYENLFPKLQESSSSLSPENQKTLFEEFKELLNSLSATLKDASWGNDPKADEVVNKLISLVELKNLPRKLEFKLCKSLFAFFEGLPPEESVRVRINRCLFRLRLPLLPQNAKCLISAINRLKDDNPLWEEEISSLSSNALTTVMKTSFLNDIANAANFSNEENTLVFNKIAKSSPIPEDCPKVKTLKYSFLRITELAYAYLRVPDQTRTLCDLMQI